MTTTTTRIILGCDSIEINLVFFIYFTHLVEWPSIYFCSVYNLILMISHTIFSQLDIWSQIILHCDFLHCQVRNILQLGTVTNQTTHPSTQPHQFEIWMEWGYLIWVCSKELSGEYLNFVQNVFDYQIFLDLNFLAFDLFLEPHDFEVNIFSIQRSSSIKGCLPSKVIIKGYISFQFGTLSEFFRLEVHLTLSLRGGAGVKSFTCITQLRLCLVELIVEMENWQ